MLQKEDIFVSVMRQSYHVPCKMSVFVVGRECQESPKKDAGSIRSTLTAYIWLSPFLSLSLVLRAIAIDGCVYLWCVHRAKDAAEIMIKESGAGEVH